MPIFYLNEDHLIVEASTGNEMTIEEFANRDPVEAELEIEELENIWDL